MAQQVRLYECMYIVDPGLSPEEVEEVGTGMRAALEEAGGEFHADYEWARRRLAYRIKGFGEGLYRIMYFDSTGDAADQVLRHADMDTRVIRAMIFVANPKTIFRPREPMAEEPVAAEGEGEADIEAEVPAAEVEAPEVEPEVQADAEPSAAEEE
jgi:small subunit ribosomal protein S6